MGLDRLPPGPAPGNFSRLWRPQREGTGGSGAACKYLVLWGFAVRDSPLVQHGWPPLWSTLGGAVTARTRARPGTSKTSGHLRHWRQTSRPATDAGSVKSSLIAGAALLTGLAIGALGTSHVASQIEFASWQTCGAGFFSEQWVLADRASREGDPLSEARHALNVAEESAGVGWAWVAREQARGPRSAWRWLYATLRFSYPYLDELSLPDDVQARGDALIESRFRARAALALHDAGLESAAATEWQRAVAVASPFQSEDALRRIAAAQREPDHEFFTLLRESQLIADPVPHERAGEQIRQLLDAAIAAESARISSADAEE